jgi:hypothetical protein
MDQDLTFEFEYLSISDARQTYPALWQTVQRALPGLSDEELTVVVSLVVDTCPRCHEDNSSCQCWNDE